MKDSPYKDAIAAALVPSTRPIEFGSVQARARRDVTRELEHQIRRSLWRAERRGRRLPLTVRQGARWVNAQRRKIAHELTRALRSLGAGTELAAAVATKACNRFPKDGVVLPDAPTRPRARGEAPRQLEQNPRAQGVSPRQRGTSPRQRRAAADLGISNPNVVATGGTITAEPGRYVDVNYAVARLHERHAPAKSIHELAPDWAAIKETLKQGLEPHERTRAAKAAGEARSAVEKAQRRKSHPPPTTDERS